MLVLFLKIFSCGLFLVLPKGCALFTTWCLIVCWVYPMLITLHFGAGLIGLRTLVIGPSVWFYNNCHLCYNSFICILISCICIRIYCDLHLEYYSFALSISNAMLRLHFVESLVHAFYSVCTHPMFYTCSKRYIYDVGCV